MKVIDLLNMISKGEKVPEKIKYRGLMYYQDGRGYFHDETEYTTERAFLEGVRTDMVLNEEVQIIEPIEDEFIDIEELNSHNIQDEMHNCNYNDFDLVDIFSKKINDLIKNQKKIIDKLKEEGK